MILQIRLKKSVAHNRAIYYIILTSKHKSSFRGFIEKLGSYTPQQDRWSNKYVFINETRLHYWICKGARLDSLLCAFLLKPVLID